MVALLGRATSLLFGALLLVIARPDLESITFPVLSIMRVLDPDVPLLPTVEFPVVAEPLLYVLDDRPL